MKWFIAIFTALFQSILSVLFKRSSRKVSEADMDKAKREKLRRKIRQYWFGISLPIMLTLTCGCMMKTIYVPDGVPVRLRQTVKNVKVWVKDKEGKTEAGKMDIPEGWYCLPLDKDD